MNVQHSLIRQFMIYEFEASHRAVEANKNIYCVKGERAIDHNTVTKWLKKFCSVCKHLDKQAMSGMPKTMDS